MEESLSTLQRIFQRANKPKKMSLQWNMEQEQKSASRKISSAQSNSKIQPNYLEHITIGNTQASKEGRKRARANKPAKRYF
jgi:hypothetical protein